MLALFISLFYTITIIIVTIILLAFRKELRNKKFLFITLMGTYSLGKWLLLKMPEIKMMSWITFGDSLLIWLIIFSFIVLPFFNILDKYIQTNNLTEKEEKSIFWLFILFLVMHTIPEAIQIGYTYNFVLNWTIGWVTKAIIEEIPEFIMLLSLYIIMSWNKSKWMILGVLTSILFPITTLMVSIFAKGANESLEIMTKNILLWFYIIFWIMSFNLILKYDKKYLVLFMILIWLFWIYRSFIWI